MSFGFYQEKALMQNMYLQRGLMALNYAVMNSMSAPDSIFYASNQTSPYTNSQDTIYQQPVQIIQVPNPFTRMYYQHIQQYQQQYQIQQPQQPQVLPNNQTQIPQQQDSIDISSFLNLLKPSNTTNTPEVVSPPVETPPTVSAPPTQTPAETQAGNQTPPEIVSPASDTIETNIPDSVITENARRILDEQKPFEPQEGQKETQTEEYKVKPGDSLSKIAIEYKVPVKERKLWFKKLQAINELDENLNIKAGQTLIIPVYEFEEEPKKEKSNTPNAEEYKVKSGDSLTKIAINYGVPVNSRKAWFNKIKELNGLDDKLNIRADQKLIIPLDETAKKEKTKDTESSKKTKPSQAASTEKPKPIEVIIRRSSSLNENEIAIEYSQALAKNKEVLMPKLGIDNKTYNKLARVALGIAAQESEYGEGTKYFIKENFPWVVKMAKKLEGDNSSSSRGLTQMKVKDHTSKKVQDLYKEFGITENTIGQPEKSALATMILLASMHTDELPSLHEHINKLDIKEEEAILYLWQGKRSQITNETATPDTNIYIQNIKKKISDNFVIKEIENLTPKQLADLQKRADEIKKEIAENKAKGIKTDIDVLKEMQGRLAQTNSDLLDLDKKNREEKITINYNKITTEIQNLEKEIKNASWAMKKIKNYQLDKAKEKLPDAEKKYKEYKTKRAAIIKEHKALEKKITDFKNKMYG